MHIIGQEELDAVETVIRSRKFMRYRGGENGFTETFEIALCEKIGVRHALAVNSGTSALICGLVGLGVGPGDEVIVPGYTFIATAFAVLATGAVPIIAEIDESLTLDPEDVQRKISPYTKAIIPVHMLNSSCDMDKLQVVADTHNIAILEDACQAVGVSHKDKHLGAIGRAGAFSFNQFKNLSCGEGGALLTNDDEIYERALIYHDGGAYTRQYASSVQMPFYAGMNFRASEFSGAIMGEQLKRLDPIIAGLRRRRRLLAEAFRKTECFRLTPHHNGQNAIGLCILFADKVSANAFAEDSQRRPLIDTDRHVYCNWQPVMEQNVVHPKLNPYVWARRKISYTADMCPATLDILSRTFQIGFGYDTPLSEVEASAKQLLACGAGLRT